MIPFLLLAPMLLTSWGIFWIYVWCLDWHDASRYAQQSAERIVEWARLEADVIAAERAIGARIDIPVYELPDSDLPGMWERADFMGGQHG